MTTLLTRTPAAPVDVTSEPAGGEPATALAGTAADRLALAVAPATGRFRPAPGRAAVDGSQAGPGDGQQVSVAAGCVLGHVTGGRGRADEIVAPVGGAVRRVLVRPGQLVFAGQALVWIERAAADGSAPAGGEVTR